MEITRPKHTLKGKPNRGFTLIEVILAVIVMTVAFMGLLAGFAASVSTVQQSRQDSIARQEAQQFIEGIYAARNTAAITFANLQNTSQDPVNGIFKDGLQPANQPGPDGMMNTADDLPALETGPDGKQLTLQRQILITPFLFANGTVDPNMRQITITIEYGAGTFQRTYKEVTYISVYR